MRILLWVILAAIWPVTATYAQPPTKKILPLAIGDTIPEELVLSNVYNNPVSKIQLSSLRGKLVILDFWATWCAACLKGIPKAEELQAQFKDHLQIIMIDSDTSESISKVTSFLQKRIQRTGQKLTLPYAVQNPSLKEYFPHEEIPHYVWINETGKVIAITTSDELTAENVVALKSAGKTIFSKRDDLRFNLDKPLLIDENGGDDPGRFIYRSILTGYIEHLGTISGPDVLSDKEAKRFFAINLSVFQLLKYAYPKVFKNYDLARVVVESNKYSSKQLLDVEEGAKKENRFCYEIITTPISRNELESYMQEDIRRTLKLSVRNETRLMDCYSLTTFAKIKYLKSDSTTPSIDFGKPSPTKHISNQRFGTMTRLLQNILKTPVLDESNIDYNIDLSFPANIYDFNYETLKSFLAKNGIIITPVKRNIEMVIISDYQY